MSGSADVLDLDVAAALRRVAFDSCRDEDEANVVARFLEQLTALEPSCWFAVRLGDARTHEAVRVYSSHPVTRAGLLHERFTLPRDQLANVKSAVASSSRLRFDDRWDSPFLGSGPGFALALVAGGEVMGVIDIADGPDLTSSPAVVAARRNRISPIANQLAVVARSISLEKQLLATQANQSRVLDHSGTLVMGLDHRLRVTSANRALLDLLGRRLDDVVGCDLRDLVPEDQRAQVSATFAAGVRGAPRRGVELRLQAGDRRRVRTVWTLTVVGNGEAADCVVAIGDDQSRLADLEAQVARAERLATLGTLAAGVVHELNNPLTSIMVYAEFLLTKWRGTGDEADLEKLRRILSAAERLQRFSRDLIHYGRPPASAIEQVDVNDVVGQSVRVCQHLLEQAHIVLLAELSNHVPRVPAVPGQLQQVLINLITNASHAVGDRGSIRVRTRSTVAAVEVEVSDSGPGVPEADRERIFEPFFTTKVDGHGTGLGLPIVRNIVEQHRGTVRVGSSDLGGAAFVVELPTRP